MSMSIANRLRPFSHAPATVALLPGTPLQFTIYPCRVEIRDNRFADELLAIIVWAIKGPVKDFTVQLDLEKGVLWVWMKIERNFFRYKLQAQEGGFDLVCDKAPKEGAACRAQIKKEGLSFEGAPVLKAKDKFLARGFSIYNKNFSNRESLSLGVHKAQQWQGVKKRSDMAEIFPFWLRLGQNLPSHLWGRSGNFHLLHSIAGQIEKKSARDLISSFESLFLAGFQGLFCPRLQDEEWQGLAPEWDPKESASPDALLSGGAKLIRSLFVHESNDCLFLLPLLPPSFISGRFLNISCRCCDVDLEWSKSFLRKIRLKAKENAQISLHLPKAVRCFRLQGDKKRETVGRNPSRLSLQKGQTYFLDRFLA